MDRIKEACETKVVDGKSVSVSRFVETLLRSALHFSDYMIKPHVEEQVKKLTSEHPDAPLTSIALHVGHQHLVLESEKLGAALSMSASSRSSTMKELESENKPKKPKAKPKGKQKKRG